MRVGIYSKKLCFYELFILTIMNSIFDVMHMYAVEMAVVGELQHATERWWNVLGRALLLVIYVNGKQGMSEPENT